jgi:iron complex outermembrane receptor protein/outer membrane receptor for ferrienterochelin and colicins
LRIILSEFFFRTPLIKKATIESGIRTDFTNRYGSFFLPSLAGIYHFDEHWAARGGIGLGYKSS